MVVCVAATQNRVLSLFPYALNLGGYLFLGSSESIGGFASLFDAVDKKSKVFRRREVAEHHSSVS